MLQHQRLVKHRAKFHQCLLLDINSSKIEKKNKQTFYDKQIAFRGLMYKKPSGQPAKLYK